MAIVFGSLTMPGFAQGASPRPEILRAAGTVSAGDTTSITFDAILATRCRVSFLGPRGLKSGPYRQNLRGGLLRASWRVNRRVAAGTWTVVIACTSRSERPGTTRLPLRVRGPSDRGIGLIAKGSFRFSIGKTGRKTVPQTLTPQDNRLPPAGEQLGAESYDNARIADIGLSRLNQRAGQCKQAVNGWVFEASGRGQRLGGNYFSNYAAQGGVQVTRDRAAKGDIIQLHNPADERGYYWPMHTAVVLSHQPGSNVFEVVDSNSAGDEIVYRRLYNPYAAAVGRLNVTIWRMGTVNPADPGLIGVGVNDLYFVKTKNTGSGSVEAFTATAASGYTSGISSAAPRFSPADANNGWFGLLPNTDLYFVKTRNTESGKVEAFTATAASGYQTGVSSVTRFSPGDANNGWFGLLPNTDLYFVKTKNTGSDRVEVHTATGASGYQTGISVAAPRFSSADANNGWFRLLS